MQPTTWNDERITSYVLGELSASESSQLEAEIQSNPEMARAVEEARGITTQLSAMFAAEPTMALDAVKRKRILETQVSGDGSQVQPPLHRYSGGEGRGEGENHLAVQPLNLAVSPVNTGDATGQDEAITSLASPTSRPSRSWLRYLALAATLLMVGTLGTLVYQSQRRNQVVNELAMAKATTTAPSQSEVAVVQSQRELSDEVDFALSKGMLASDGLERGGEALEVAEEKGLKMLREKEVSAPAAASVVKSIPIEESLNESIDAEKQERSYNFALGTSPATESKPAAAARTFYRSDSISPNSDALMDGASSKGVGVAQNTVMSDAETEAYSELRKHGATPYWESKKVQERKLQLEAQGIVPEGRGAGLGGDRFEPIQENGFRRVNEEPLSTFSIDVDTASYSKVRQFVLQSGGLPPAGAVRIEELVNYFDYDYEPPAANGEHPFASRAEIAACPWKPEHRLARIAIKGKVMTNESRPASNLVFLVDTSGSMNEPNRLPLVKQGLQKLVSRLGERDRVAIVVYAGSAGLVLDSTPANDRSTILRKINQMQSGGSTNGGEGIRLAYRVARDHFIKDGINRVILCSDGDFNVGTTSDDELVRLVETESKGGIDITVLGFGMGNHNDAMMEKISGRGNGNYAFIDSDAEAQRVLVEQTSATLVTIARDVKIQVEFNPAVVAAYRLIGYENRKLANEDFKDDTKDAGEIGAGHSVTALYELIPANGDVAALAPTVDELRYQKQVTPTDASKSGELMTVKLRYKKPDSDSSIPVSFAVTDDKRDFAEASVDFKFAAAVAGFGMLLRSSEHIGNWTLSDVKQVAEGSKGNDPHGLRTEFVEIVKQAAQLRGSEQ